MSDKRKKPVAYLHPHSQAIREAEKRQEEWFAMRAAAKSPSKSISKKDLSNLKGELSEEILETRLVILSAINELTSSITKARDGVLPALKEISVLLKEISSSEE
tara:strand:+ start:849 stop:1160 length:312 start_codon:yes stop_codon:yes gene_type:complete